MRRFVSIGLAGALALVVSASFSGVAGAQGYTGSVTSVTPSTSSAPEGGTFEVSGTTDTPGTTVTFVLGSQNLGSTTSGADRTFRVTLRVPCGTAQGPQTLTASSGGSSRSSSLTVNGSSSACDAGTGGGGTGGGGTGAGGTGSGGGGALPRTGTASTAPLTAAGVGLVLFGALAVAASRRRRSAQAIES